MSGKPWAIVRIDDLKSHLRATLKKADVPRSMQAQMVGIVGHYLRHRLSGWDAIFPGMKNMAEWGGCSERQARENFARLRLYGVVEPTGHEKGGRRRATEFRVSLVALKRFLITVRANPSPALIEKLETADPRPGNPEVNPEANPEAKPAGNPEEKPEATSARSKKDRGAPAEASKDPARNEAEGPANVVVLARRRVG